MHTTVLTSRLQNKLIWGVCHILFGNADIRTARHLLLRLLLLLSWRLPIGKGCLQHLLFIHGAAPGVIKVFPAICVAIGHIIILLLQSFLDLDSRLWVGLVAYNLSFVVALRSVSSSLFLFRRVLLHHVDLKISCILLYIFLIIVVGDIGGLLDWVLVVIYIVLSKLRYLLSGAIYIMTLLYKPILSALLFMLLYLRHLLH